MKLLCLLGLVVLVSCSTHKHTKKSVEQKAKESKVTDGHALGHTLNEILDSSTTLTDAQKAEIRAIMAENRATAERLTEESFRVRAVLVKAMLTTPINKREVGEIKKKIKKIEEQRLVNTFTSVEKVTKLVSNEPHNEDYVEPLAHMGRDK